MDDALRGLLGLKELDEKMAGVRSSLEKKPKVLRAHQREVETAERELSEVRDQVKDLQKIVDRKSVELQAAEDAVVKLSGQLNTLKTNEEYAAMQKQIAGKNTTITGIEDTVLESMEVVERAKTELPPREVKLAEQRTKLSEEETRVTSEVKDLEGELGKLESEWDQKATGVEAGLLERYRRLRADHGATALVPVSPEGICKGCYTKVTSNVLNTAVAGRLVECTSCYRMLFLV
ncbi:MAG: hypothetical protein CMJ83_14065 [Planctomycetes bacterium]|nr:hypothetical protein [Planctomycetota bacterium]